jgi:3-hydroxy-9,10-secoandrosta-1,3,5(10)-triene-9,17-dione monooxygenase reductase component
LTSEIIGFDDDPALPGLSLEQARYRQVLGHFASGVTVVTAPGPLGFTCQAFAALSLDPALVAFAPSRSSTTWARIAEVGVFCVNVLTDTQEPLARVFATKGADKFRGVAWSSGTTGSPIIADVLAWVECRLIGSHDGGDHLLAVGEVLDLGVRSSGQALVFYRGGFGRFEP